MRAALGEARLAPEAIAYLNLHGTGTPHNDAMESLALARVFGAVIAVAMLSVPSRTSRMFQTRPPVAIGRDGMPS